MQLDRLDVAAALERERERGGVVVVERARAVRDVRDAGAALSRPVTARA